MGPSPTTVVDVEEAMRDVIDLELWPSTGLVRSFAARDTGDRDGCGGHLVLQVREWTWPGSRGGG
ncbi:hypothetical protein L1785_08955 [Antribacter sp. KLBMP9083]|uniref:Uncharacterized protein n=1 Tax=Antribacter soli TaxID=2910976 RepID=A0AA41U793_9MICO|nr:hypothetical protein [Antribacter soli]MCF4121110.1 hypothetical protein [Antribacter soli]